MVTKNKAAVAKANDNLPARATLGFVEMEESAVQRQAKGRGNENVQAKDKLIPRLEIVQDKSKPVRKKEAEYIPGIEPGQLYNTVTRENYGNRVAIVPVFFRTVFNIWRKRDLGGGFFGTFESLEAAQAAVPGLKRAEGKALVAVTMDEIDILETYENYAFILTGAGGAPEFVSISMSKTKQRPARRFNSLIDTFGGDRWDYAYWLAAVEETSKVTGDNYFNFSLAFAGVSTLALRQLGTHFWQQMNDSATAKKTDYSEDGAVAGGHPEPGAESEY